MHPFYNRSYDKTVDIYIFTKRGEEEYYSSIHNPTREGIETEKKSLYLYSMCDVKRLIESDVYFNDLYMYALLEMDVL